MNQKIKDYVKAYCLKKGYECETDEDILETILESSEEVWSGESDSHRWYDLIETVVDLDGLFIGYQRYHITGDNCMSDMGLEYNLDDFVLVEPKEVMTTIYVPIKD